MTGACHALFSRHFFDEAKAEVIALKKEQSKLTDLVDVVEDQDGLVSLKVPTAVGAVVSTKTAKLAPYKLVTWVLETLIKKSSLNLQTSTPVTSISRLGNHKWSISTPRGLIETSHALLATNGYSSHLLPQFESLIVPVQGEMSVLTPPHVIRHDPLDYTYGFVGEVSNDGIQDDYLIQRPIELGSQLMFGGGRALAEKAGVNVDRDDAIDPAAAKYLRTVLGRYLDILKGDEGKVTDSDPTEKASKSSMFKAEAEWSGVMGFSRDSVPWVGGVPNMEGVWLCGGYTGHGRPSSCHVYAS